MKIDAQQYSEVAEPAGVAESSAPTDPDQRFCDTHGAFTVNRIMNPFEPDKVLFTTKQCPTCTKIEQALREAIELKALVRERIQRSGIPTLRDGYGFDSYPMASVPAEYREKAAKVVNALRRWCTAIPDLRKAALEGSPAHGLWAALIGSMGSGKSGLAYAVALHAASLDIGVRYFTATGLVSHVWDAKLRGSWSAEAVSQLSLCGLLIIDEIGIKGTGENEAAQITEVMDGRYRNRLPTLLISNGKKHEVQACLGDRISDRFEELGHWFRLDWPSLRNRNNAERANV